MKDTQALMEYLRSPAFVEETGDKVDQCRIVVSGGSAGGWLALLVASGIGYKESGLVPPAPVTAAAALYPMTDITDIFFTTQQHRTWIPVAFEPGPH